MVYCEPSDEAKKAEVLINNPAPSDSAPGPGDPSSAPAATNKGNMHSVMQIVQEKELGKILLAGAIGIVGIVVAGKDKLGQSERSFVLVLVCVGFSAILDGILLKETFPKFAQIVEVLGVALVTISFFSIVIVFLPVQIVWVPAVCICLCLLPFVILV